MNTIKKAALIIVATTPIIAIGNVSNFNYTEETNYSYVNQDNETRFVEELFETNLVDSSSNPPSDKGFVWRFDLNWIIENSGMQGITYITIPEQEVNFRYEVKWEEDGFWGDDVNKKYFWTKDGPGDNNGHTGWNEAEYNGHVIFNETQLEFGERALITSGKALTYYDEDIDDANDPGTNNSGYSWGDYSIYAEIFAEDGIDFLEFEWVWTDDPIAGGEYINWGDPSASGSQTFESIKIIL